MRKPILEGDIADPQRIIGRMIADYAEGNLGGGQVLLRVSVVAVDQVGGQFESSPPNPKGSIKGRLITNFTDAYTSEDDLPVFYPMFSHQRMPIKEGEHAYVIFEDEAKTHGLWLTRISQNLADDSKNYASGVAPYLSDPDNGQAGDLNAVSSANVDKLVAGTVDSPPVVQPALEFTTEDTPDFVARIGDFVIHGSNNAMIVMGRDRPSDISSGQASNAGTIDLVVGRASGSSDMNIAQDGARVYISNKTDADLNFGTQQKGAGPVPPPDPQPSATVGAIANQIRIVARDGMRIIVNGGDLVIDGNNIVIGNGATEPAVLGEQLKTYLTNLMTALATHTHAETGTTTAVPTIPTAFTDLALPTALTPLVSNTVKVKG